MISTIAAALTTMAIVTQDQVPLRAAPRESAQTQAVIWQGESLEIRGEKGDYLQVYDHRLERAGYVRASQVKKVSLKPESAHELLSVVRFLQDTPGAEALGISYTAAYLKAVPAQELNVDAYDALGNMASRLARRASVSTTTKQNKNAETTLSAHLEVAAYYGVNMKSFEREGHMQLCYDGDAYFHLFSHPANDLQRAKAALALTQHECVSPTLNPVQRYELDLWRADLLEKVNIQHLPEVIKNRLHMRKAGILAGLAYQQTRHEKPAIETATRAVDELAAVNKNEMMEYDSHAYNEAAIKVGASRWAAQTIDAPNTSKLYITTTKGQTGETCVNLMSANTQEKEPLLSKCTFGVVWKASSNTNANNSALALAVQPLEGWRELWMFRKTETGWQLDIMPPAFENPDLGYVEFAGWVPGGKEMLTARETRIKGNYKQRFELNNLSTLETIKFADKPSSLSKFYRWQDANWKRQTVSIR